MLNFDRIEKLSGPAPLHAHYQGQHEPQPAYVYLYENGIVDADYSGEIGNARPADEWHNRTLTWRITPFLSVAAIEELLTTDPVKGLLERVHAGHDTEWDGNNMAGTLTDDAQGASDKLERIFADEEPDIEVWNVEEWLFSSAGLLENWPAGDMDLDAAVSAAEDSVDNSEMTVIVTGDAAEALLDRAQYYLTSLQKGLGQNHFAALLADGRATQEEIDEYLNYFVPSPAGIRAARRAAGLTQEKAAEIIGATRRAWQEWEAGRRNMPWAKWELFQIKVEQLQK